MERVRSIAATPEGHDPALQHTFAEAGWLGLLVPEEHGGAGLSLLDAAVLLEEMGRACVPGPYLISSVGAVLALREAGTAAQQARWLPGIASGECVATLAILEGPEPRLDGAGIAERATRRGGGHLLEGVKLFVEHASNADLVIAAFRTARARGAEPFDGVRLFAVPARTRGLRREPLVGADELRRDGELRFRNVQVDADALLGRGERRHPGRAFARVLDGCAVAVAAESLGGAERCLERAAEYVKLREQFGRPVGTFQAVQHMAAEAAARIEPARALLWWAAWAFDARPDDAPLAAAMAKAACSDVFRAVSRSAVEMHGGVGFTWENDMHLYFKRALASAARFGDAAHHRERVAELARF
jgi:alkylation response protein AidB-like acyl-CoA dehydrogenase